MKLCVDIQVSPSWALDELLAGVFWLPPGQEEHWLLPVLEGRTPFLRGYVACHSSPAQQPSWHCYAHISGGIHLCLVPAPRYFGGIWWKVESWAVPMPTGGIRGRTCRAEKLRAENSHWVCTFAISMCSGHRSAQSLFTLLLAGPSLLSLDTLVQPAGSSRSVHGKWDSILCEFPKSLAHNCCQMEAN